MVIDMLLWAMVLTALYTDITKRKIYNATSVTGMAAGLGLNLYERGWEGLVMSGTGLFLGLLLFILPFILGGMGAGDVKLLAAIGAIKGPQFVWQVALGSILAGGLIAVVILIKQKRFLSSLKNIGMSIYTLVLAKDGHSLKKLDQAEYNEAFPYGVAIAAGTLAAALMG
ncbi:MAG: A24 family peptidase [Clostridia bacterium]|nr:A24 family peptidase [Clostridia bacterium]